MRPMLTSACGEAPIVICACNLAAVPSASVALSQKVLVTTVVGLPLISPVLEFRAKPCGRAPALTEKV